MMIADARRDRDLVLELSALAEIMLGRPLPDLARTKQLEALLPKLAEAAARLTDRERVDVSAVMLASALEQLDRARRRRDDKAATQWAMIAGALYPMARDNASALIIAALTQRASA